MQSSRKKSCTQCRLAKTRCSLSIPRCSRCDKRNISCAYEHGLRTETRFPSGNDSMFHSWVAATRSPIPVALDPNLDLFSQMGLHGISGSRTVESSTEEVPDFGMEIGQTVEYSYRGWNNSQSAETIAEELPEMGSGIVDDDVNRSPTEGDNEQSNVCWLNCGPSSADEQNDRNSTLGQPAAITVEDGASLLLSLSTGIKRSSAFVTASWPELKQIPDSLPNLLNRKPMTKVVSMTVSNFLWATIKSYAVSFSGATLPPFVHRGSFAGHTQSSSGEALNVSEPLANCHSIVPMYLQKTPACTNIILRTLLLEVQRIHDEFRTYDERTLTHAVQALAIYTILLAADDERCNVTSTVVRIAMGEVAAEATKNGCLAVSESRGNFPTMRDWMYAESKRRTMILLHFLAMLVDVDIGTSRPTGCAELDNIPLPSSKALWEADTQEKWETEYKNYLSTRKCGQMLKIGTFRQSHELDVDILDKDIVSDLASWSKGVDSFGAMIIMGVSGL